MAVVLDTCAWLWMCSEPKRLSPAAAEAIRSERGRAGLLVSVFSCWEVAKLVQKGKLEFSIRCADWIDRAVRRDGIALQGLTPEICIASTELPGVFHGDPADQIIVATARVLGVPLVTADRKLIAYPHVATVW